MGRPHLHSHCNFTESILKTVAKSFYLSCGSELHVQSISYLWHGLYLHPLISRSQRVVSTGSLTTSLGITLFIGLHRYSWILNQNYFWIWRFNPPDKEFRSIVLLWQSNRHIYISLYSSDSIFSISGVWRISLWGFQFNKLVFPADCLHLKHYQLKIYNQ